MEQPYDETLANESVEAQRWELSEHDLDPEDIAKARVQAAKRGLRYQTYLKMIIHEALLKAEVANV